MNDASEDETAAFLKENSPKQYDKEESRCFIYSSNDISSCNAPEVT
jgi:hypothetical protein